MGVKAGSIRLLDSRERLLVLGAEKRSVQGYVRKGPILIEESASTARFCKARPSGSRTSKTDKDFRVRAKAKAEGIKSVLVVPLLLEKKAIGVLRVYTDRVRKFKEEEIKFLKAVANLSAIGPR